MCVQYFRGNDPKEKKKNGYIFGQAGFQIEQMLQADFIFDNFYLVIMLVSLCWFFFIAEFNI